MLPATMELVDHDEPEAKKSERLKSLDCFRGLVIAVMIFVDDSGAAYGGHWDHSPWNDVTLAGTRELTCVASC
jgi:predicted acyltransferase